MTRRHARTDLLDRVSVPDLWPDIQRRAPGSPGEVGPPSNGRPAAVAVALIVAILGVGLSVYALSGVRHAGGPVGPSPAAPPTGPLIAFTTASRDSGVNPDLRIAVMRPDGSEVTRLTTGQEPDTYITRYGYSQDLDPEWSPDGQTIYFLRRYSESVYSLCSVTSSGKGFDIIVRDFPSGEFALSPAGTQVAFAGDHGMHAMDIDGSNDHLLAHVEHLPYGVPASWSPNGKAIAFVSGLQQLWIVDVTSGRLTRLLPGAQVTTALWDPAGGKIAISMQRRSRVFSSQVWTVGPDGTGARRITDRRGNWIPAAWSPDGSRLLLGRLDDRSRDHGLAVFNADGSGPVVIEPTSPSAWAAWRA